MIRKLTGLLLLILLLPGIAAASWLLVPMDGAQGNHLKAYGQAFAVLKGGGKVFWMLNYRGGAFLMPDEHGWRMEAHYRGVDFEIIDDAAVARIRATVAEENMEEVLLEKPPRIAIYAPPNYQPWDDAVTLALTYADIPFDTVFDAEVLAGELEQYDWLHLHHEDFTGQYGKFHLSSRYESWYLRQKAMLLDLSQTLGFPTVWQMKHAVALKILDYVENGGFMFAMCSATDTIDIALAYLNVDIVPPQIDGTGLDPRREEKRDDDRTFACRDFTLETNPAVYEFSSIDTSDYARARGPIADYFTLFNFSAKHDPVPTMLTQSHENTINGFMGQTTGFHREFLKRQVIILAQVEGTDEIRYLHGKKGTGTFTFLGGHDPEDYQHRLGDQPTDLDLYRNSPGYRLILNNILFPAARKKPQKT
jgi:hypothetical protein